MHNTPFFHPTCLLCCASFRKSPRGRSFRDLLVPTDSSTTNRYSNFQKYLLLLRTDSPNGHFEVSCRTMKQKVIDSEKSVDPIFRITGTPGMEKEESEKALEKSEGECSGTLLVIVSSFRSWLHPLRRWCWRDELESDLHHSHCLISGSHRRSRRAYEWMAVHATDRPRCHCSVLRNRQLRVKSCSCRLRLDLCCVEFQVQNYQVGDFISQKVILVFRWPLIAGRLIAIVACCLYLCIEYVPTGRRYMMMFCYILFDVSGSSPSILRAYIAAISMPKDRSKAFATMSLSMVLSIIMGPCELRSGGIVLKEVYFSDPNGLHNHPISGIHHHPSCQIPRLLCSDLDRKLDKLHLNCYHCLWNARASTKDQDEETWAPCDPVLQEQVFSAKKPSIFEWEGLKMRIEKIKKANISWILVFVVWIAKCGKTMTARSIGTWVMGPVNWKNLLFQPHANSFNGSIRVDWNRNSPYHFHPYGRIRTLVYVCHWKFHVLQTGNYVSRFPCLKFL